MAAHIDKIQRTSDEHAMGFFDGNTSTVIFTCLAVLMTLLRKYKPFRAWFTSLFETSLSEYFLPSKKMIISAPHFTLTKNANHFKSHGNTTLHELTEALTQLQEYYVRGQRQNGVLFNRTRELEPTSLQQLRSIKYFSKIDEVNRSIAKNYVSAKLIIHYVLKTMVENNAGNEIDEYLPDQLKTICADFGYLLKDNNELVHTGENIVLATSDSKQGRVVEALGHLCRDWSPLFENERSPLDKFINSRLKVSLRSCKETDALVIVPGSGAGRLAFSIAKNLPRCQVDSIEWSSLLYIFNQFALDYPDNITISPFSQYYSGHLDTKSQVRGMDIELKPVKRPENLTVHWGDFRQYTTNNSHYKCISVCTAFFIDTAENLFEYFEAIEQLADHCDELHWINIGPLKYGTRPLVQLTTSELKELRALRGWEDQCEEIVKNYEDKLNGYLTDYESLYQGYYGLLKFHSIFRKSDKK